MRSVNAFIKRQTVCSSLSHLALPYFIECGSVVNDSLKSPGYPNNYPNNVDCVYSVPIPQKTEMIIDFRDFGLEYISDCV